MRDEDLRLNIILDGKQVPRENKKLMSELGKLERAGMDLEREYTRLVKRQKELNDLQKKGYDAGRAAELVTVKKRMDMLNDAMKLNAQQQKEMRQQVGLTGLTLNQLRTHLKLLQIEQSNITQSANPKVWKQLQKEIDATNYQIKKLTTNSTWLGMLWDDVAKKANKYGAAIGAIGLVVYQVTDFIGQFTNDLRQLEDNMAGVRRTTDLTREQVVELKKAFDQMDTRTSANDLLEIAKVAGRLGITGQDNILGFTDAMNKLNVALGEDLMQGGQGSIEDVAKSVGKLVQNFHLDDELPLNEALLRTGSVLNQLDKSSTASAGYIVEFTSRLSAIAPSVGMTIDQVAGLAAYLDSAGVNSEMATTAIQRFLVGMGENATKYAKILGVSIEEYTEMTKKDINSTFLTLLERTVSSADGVKELSDEMAGLGVNQQLAVQTLSKIGEGLKAEAGGMDKVRKQQEIAREAYKSSDSVMKEYAITNENFTALMEKQEKRVTALRNSVGLELEPAVLGLKKTYVDLLYVLRDVGKWIGDHWRLITSAAIAFATYKVNVLLAGRGLTTFSAVMKGVFPAMTALRSKWILFVAEMGKLPTTTTRAGFAFKKMMAILNKNMVLVVVSAIAALTVAIIALSRKANDTSGVMKKFYKDIKEGNEEIRDSFTEQETNFKMLFDELRRNFGDLGKRKKIIGEINEQYGEYIGNIDAEKTSLTDLNKIQEEGNRALMKNLAIKQMSEEIIAVNKKGLTAEKEVLEVFKKATEEAGLTAEQTGQAYMDLYNLADKAEMFKKLGVDMGKVFWIIKNGGLGANEAIKDLFSAKGYNADDFIKPLTTLGVFSKQYKVNTADFLKDIFDIRTTTEKETENIEKFVNAKVEQLGNNVGISNLSNFKTGKIGSIDNPDDNNPESEAEKEKKDRIEREKDAIEAWYKQQEVDLMNQQRNLGESEDWFNNEMLKKEKEYIRRMLAIAGLEETERVALAKQKVQNLNKIDDADHAQQLAEIERNYKDKIAEIEKWHQEELKAGGNDSTEYEQMLGVAELMYLNDRMLFAKNEEEKLKLQEEFVEKQTALLEKLNKARTDANKEAANGAKQVKNEYRKDLNDELKYLKEFGKLFEDSVLGNVILLKRQLQANQDVYDEDIEVLRSKLSSKTITEKEFADLSTALWAEKEKKEKQLTEETQMRVLQISMATGQEMATNVANRYSDRLKQEAALQEQLKNGEITQLEYQKKVSALKKKNQKQFLKDMLIMLLKSLQAATTAYIVEGAAASMATHMKEGWIGLATGAAQAAALTAAINIPFEIAKAKLQATQFATGKYPVTGASDGRTYNATYAGKPQTGLYKGPQIGLFNENPRMPELVVDGLTTRKLMLNYPDIYSSILALSGKHTTKQYAEGQYPATSIMSDSNRRNNDAQVAATLELVAMELARLRTNGVNANVDIYQIDKSLTEIESRRASARG